MSLNFELFHFVFTSVAEHLIEQLDILDRVRASSQLGSQNRRSTAVPVGWCCFFPEDLGVAALMAQLQSGRPRNSCYSSLKMKPAEEAHFCANSLRLTKEDHRLVYSRMFLRSGSSFSLGGRHSPCPTTIWFTRVRCPSPAGANSSIRVPCVNFWTAPLVSVFRKYHGAQFAASPQGWVCVTCPVWFACCSTFGSSGYDKFSFLAVWNRAYVSWLSGGLSRRCLLEVVSSEDAGRYFAARETRNLDNCLSDRLQTSVCSLPLPAVPCQPPSSLLPQSHLV